MTMRPAPETQPRAGNGGCLVLIVGPSGAGKDTLIQAAREKLSRDDRFVFPQRIVTRPKDAYEPHVAVSESEFETMQSNGDFLLFWGAHGNRYGVPIDSIKALNECRTVVANVSRTIIGKTCERFSNVRVINVTAGADVLRDRLLIRARESDADIDKRIARAANVPLPQSAIIDVVDNSGAISFSITRFIGLLCNYAESGQRETILNRSPAAR